MEKRELPRLETNGFVSNNSSVSPTWRQRAAKLLRKAVDSREPKEDNTARNTRTKWT